MADTMQQEEKPEATKKNAANAVNTPAGVGIDDAKLFEAEYRELNNHLRECWKYISELLKNFTFLHIILLSLLFLGGGVIKVESISVKTNAQAVVQQSVTPTIPPTPEGGVEKFRKSTIYPILLIALLSSLGAMVQNERLFKNATNFVRRAAFLEEKAKAFEDVSADKTLPPNKYMLAEMYSGRSGTWKIDLRWVLIITYGGFAALWVYYAFSLLSLNYNFN